MSDTSQKVRALVLSLLMVSSVFAGAVAFSGTAAAAPPSNVVSDNTPSDTATPGDTTPVANVTFQNPGNVTNVTVDLSAGGDAANITTDDFGGLNVQLLNASGGVTATASSGYDSLSQQVTVSGTNVTGVKTVVVSADVAASAENNDIADATIDVTDANGDSAFASPPLDTANNQTILTNTNAFLRGTVTDTNNNPQNVTIDVIDLDTGSVAIDDIQTRDDGTWGPIETAPGNYTVVLDGPDAGKFDDFSTKVDLTADETEEIKTTLDPNLYPENIEVTPKSATEFVGNSINYTVTVTDQNGDALENVEVGAEDISGTGITVTTPNQTTDVNGQATFSVVSNEIATGPIEFTALNTTTGPNPTTTAEGTWILSGEGAIEGTVLNDFTTNPIEDARVWTVLGSQYDTNERLNNITDFDLDVDDDDTLFVRLVDNETGSIISNDAYDVRVDNNSQEGVRKVQELNVSDAAQGEGFALIDSDGDGNISFTHTRIENREYYAQVSFDAWNVSDQRLTDEGTDSQENFVNVSDFTANNQIDVDTDIVGTPTVFSPAANLTFEQTKNLAELANANLVDAPGWVNYYGENTEGTNAQGEFLLNRLYSDFQDGRPYVVIATKAGFSTDFQDVMVAEDGQLQMGDSDKVNSLRLQPEEVDPAEVNITQIGVHPPLDETGGAPDPSQITEFSDQSDDYVQEVPRDASVDVIEIATRNENGALVPANVTVDIQEVSGNFSGTFLGVLDPANDTFFGQTGDDTARLRTGDDGKATLLLQTDESAETIQAKKVATLDADASATDNSSVRWVGVQAFARASIRGDVTDTDDTPLGDTAVWAREFLYPTRSTTGLPATTADFGFRISPDVAPGVQPGTAGFAEEVDDPSDEFIVELLRYNATSNEVEAVSSATVTAENLTAYDFSDFPSVDNNGVEFKLYARSDGDLSYTLDPVPAAIDKANQRSTQYRIRSVKTDTPEIGSVSNDGLGEVQPQSTDDVDIVIPVQVIPADFQVSNLNAPSEVTQGDTVDVSATVDNVGGNGSNTKDVKFAIDLNQDGTFQEGEVLRNVSRTIEGGEGLTVNFDDIDTSGVPTGTYTHGVITEDGQATATITITENEEFSVTLDAPSEVEQGDNFTVDAEVTNTGGTTNSTQVFYVLDANQDGDFEDAGTDILLSDSTGSLAPGASETVSFEVSSDDLSEGETYQHAVSTTTNIDQGSIDVVSMNGGATTPQEYANMSTADGVIQTDELQMAITDWSTGDISTDTLQEVITAWSTGEDFDG